MRVAIFATPSSGRRVVELLRRDHEIVGLITPPGRGVRNTILATVDKVLRRNRRFEVERSDLGQLTTTLRELRPDLLCISGFPWILPQPLLASSRLGAINAHPSLLPRHRGPLPLFWIYREDDRETGVTVHRATALVDGGSILQQARFDLPRGFPVAELALKKQEVAASLLREAAEAIEGGRFEEQAQQEALATTAPKVRPGMSGIDFQTWPAERIWHFLRGLYPFFIEPLGERYRGVAGFEVGDHHERPGTLASAGGEWLLYSRDGIVRLLR
jgi:methionyl-tRNA formyltransferase